MVAEVQRLQKLADEAEASRIDGLRELINREFKLLQARLDSWPAGGQGEDGGKPPGHTALIESSAAEGPSAGPRAAALRRWLQIAS